MLECSKMQGHTHTQDKDSIGGRGVYQLLLNHKTDEETTQVSSCSLFGGPTGRREGKTIKKKNNLESREAEIAEYILLYRWMRRFTLFKK